MTKETYYETTTVFDFNFKQVAQAFWNRYPNPLSSHVLTEDTIRREIRDGKLYTRRLLSKTNHVPKWGERFYNAKSVKIIEDSILDPVNHTLITYTRNIGYKKVLKVDERVEYKEGADGKTIAIRSAWISSQVFGFSRAIRAFGVERFKSNCQKTVMGFNYVLHTMFPIHIKEVQHQQQQQQIQQQSQSLQLQQQQHKQDHVPQSKISQLKEATRVVYNAIKGQASKIYQIFSVKN